MLMFNSILHGRGKDFDLSSHKYSMSYGFRRHFPAGMNTKSSKTPTTFVPCHTNYKYGADYQLLKTYFCMIPCTILRYAKHLCMICKLIHFDVCVT